MTDKILAAAKARQAAVTGKLGFAFYDFKSGNGCCLHGDTPFPTASVFKIFLLAELFRQAEAGIIDLGARLTAEPQAASGGSGALRRFRHTESLTVYDHAVLMMMISDNTSTDLLFDLVGRENILEHLIRPLGLQQTKIDYNCADLLRSFYRERPHLRNSAAALCAEEFSDCTSPRDIITLLRSLHDAAILSKESCKEALELMQPYPKYHRLEKYLPKGTKIRRKTGSLDRISNDAGIVFTDKGDYVIAVFYNGNTASEEEYAAEAKKLTGEELISLLSRDVYDIYMEG